MGRWMRFGRAGLWCAVVVVVGWPAASAGAAEPDSGRREAVNRGAAFLTGRQSADGAWRSDVYGNFRGGDSLTPLVLAALEPDTPGFEAGCRYLADLVGKGGDDPVLQYPAYTAALAAGRLQRCGDRRAAVDRWIDVLRGHQLNGRLSWERADREFGGWGYATIEPRRPRADETRLPLMEPNLSATVFAVEALRRADVDPRDAAIAAALVFVERCQNVAAAPAAADPAFDDGGFFFVLDDAARTKAGSAGRDRHGRERLASYGSATADGLRGLLACGLPADHPRVVAARGWLERNFSADVHAGRFPADREVFRDSCYFYYAWSTAAALEAAGVGEVRTPPGQIDWRQALAAALVARQAADGSWSNEHRAVREDDPLVATSLAVATLRICGRRPPR